MIRIKIIIGLIILALYATVSTASYSDAVQEQNYYCAQVESGAWPDYKDTDC